MMCIIWNWFGTVMYNFHVSGMQMIAEGVVIPVHVVESEIVVTTPVVEIEAGVGIETRGAAVGAEIEIGSHLTAMSVAAAETETDQGTVTEAGAQIGDGKEMRSRQVGAG